MYPQSRTRTTSLSMPSPQPAIPLSAGAPYDPPPLNNGHLHAVHMQRGLSPAAVMGSYGHSPRHSPAPPPPPLVSAGAYDFPAMHRAPSPITPFPPSPIAGGADPGGFVIPPQPHSQSVDPIPPPLRGPSPSSASNFDRGRTTDRDLHFSLGGGHNHSHSQPSHEHRHDTKHSSRTHTHGHSSGRSHSRTRYEHGHGYESSNEHGHGGYTTIQQPAPGVQVVTHHEEQRHRERRHSHAHSRPTHSSSHHHTSSHSHSYANGRVPNVVVHMNGQSYTVPATASGTRPPLYAHNVSDSAAYPQIYGGSAPAIRPHHSASNLYGNSRPHTLAQPPLTHLNGNGHTHSSHYSQPHSNGYNANGGTPSSIPMPVPSLPPADAVYYGPEIANRRHFFQYSRCTGRKKALCIGINYRGQANELKGCVSDATRMRKFLIDHFGFHSGDIVLLTDTGRSSREQPTRRNILDGMRWLVKNAQLHDSLVFHYSGHGGQTPDLDGDESDGYDETIFPVDHKKTGHIVDDDMFDIMVKPLPSGCRLTAIFDCCHSGSALDLPYMYGTNGRLKRSPDLAQAAGTDTFGSGPFLDHARDVSALSGDLAGMQLSEREIREKRTNNGVRRGRGRATFVKTSPADAISWSGCKDSQTSADTYENNEPTGAMSYAFMRSLRAKPDQSYQELLTNIRRILKNDFSQKPQLSSSHPIDTKLKFVM